MEITDVRVKPINDSSERLKAVCTVTFDDVFVVRDIKVVDGVNGLFVAMPSRKVSFSCPDCGHKNVVRARYCNDCGSRLPSQEAPSHEDEGRSKMHRDIAHPITSDFRSLIQETVIGSFKEESDEFDEDDGPVVNSYARDSGNDDDDDGEQDQDEYSSIIAELKGNRGRSGGRRDGGGRDSGGRGRGGRKPRETRGRGERSRGGRSRNEAAVEESGDKTADAVSTDDSDKKDDGGGNGRRRRRTRGRGRGREEGKDSRSEDREVTREAEVKRSEVRAEKPAVPAVTEPVAQDDDDDLPFGAMIDEMPDEIVVSEEKESGDKKVAEKKSGRKKRTESSRTSGRDRKKKENNEEPAAADDQVMLEEAAEEPEVTEDANEDSSPFGLGLI